MKVVKRDGDSIKYDNGTTITYYHEQDCCENVYADWSALDDTGFDDNIINEIEIEKVEGSGFIINGYFVPCYDEQNGFYSSDLELIITDKNGNSKVIDITGCTKEVFEQCDMFL